MPPTMKDIAREAGVSQPAVSAVLNKRVNCRVSQETRERILRIAREMNYHPNQAARLLKGKKSNTVAIFTSTNISALQNEAVKYISGKLVENGLNCFTVPAKDNDDLKEHYFALLSHNIDALICFFIDFKFDRSIFNIPQVHVGLEMRDQCDISEELYEGTAYLTEHLLQHGHRNMVFVTNLLSSNAAKFSGAADTLEKSCSTASLKYLEFYRNDNIVKEILACIKDGTTAFICSNDHIAARLCKVLMFHQVRVPEDVAVTGFDGMAFSEYTTPSITTMRLDPEAIAGAAVELLLERMNKKISSQAPVKIPLHFHCGRSCGCEVPENDKFFVEKMPAVIKP